MKTYLNDEDRYINLRKQQKLIESLEIDNYQDDSSTEFDDIVKLSKRKNVTNKSRKRPKRSLEYLRQRQRKTLDALLEEDENMELYINSQAPPSKYPARKICCVCGYPSIYNCMICSSKICSIACREIHSGTRCNKWIR
ncbi:hypothetical protein GJ496_010062 [Pomphorhynchus laevis]|nr:hypothetical protein GJ496_010062 [Pomphorhynchus laevis]